MSCNVIIRYARYLICDPTERVVGPSKGVVTHRLRATGVADEGARGRPGDIVECELREQATPQCRR